MFKNIFFLSMTYGTQILHKLTTSFDTKCSTYKNSSGKDKKITGVSICDNLMDTSNTG